MSIGWPQGIYLAITAVGLLAVASLDGQPKTGTYKFAVHLVLTALTLGLLYWGGFFS